MTTRSMIPCCHFPKTLVLIDDDPLFLDALTLKVTQFFPHRAFDDPKKALQFFNQAYQANTFSKRVILPLEEKEMDHRRMDINIRAIHQELYHPQRFEQIAVIIIDYAMPGLNGLEFCQQLNPHLGIRKILLTGEAGLDIAINAFNQGLIDQYIPKNSPDLSTLLLDAIRFQQYRYGEVASELIHTSITKDPNHAPACLDDPIVIDFFWTLYQQLEAVEFYLMDTFGSFLFLDKQAKPAWLVIRNEADMASCCEMAELSDADATIVSALKQRSKILYLHTDADYEKNPSEWMPYLHPAQQLEGRETYYYALILDPNAYHFPRDKVRSYEDYLQHFDASSIEKK